ncbi:carbohydrate ABC transporter permease [Micromonospora marina]|uniref:carbohydrate ABC transporter permease n=1 Tax=Micromonospora marina TaxID=307120 RepID=UPI0034512ADF
MTLVTDRPTRGRSGAAPRPARRRRGHRHNRAAYLLLAPWLVGLLGLTAGPMIASLYLSLTEYDVLNPPTFIGGDNYVEMFTEDPRYLSSLWTTMVYVAVSVPVKLAFALGVALALNKGLRGLGFYRAVYYVPSLLGGSVAIAVMWRQIFGGDGLINSVLGALGFTDLPAWVADPDYALGTLIVLAVWQFGSPMVIFLAGLKQIPRELYEAAEVDGAGTWRRFRNVTLPLLTPVIFFNVVLQLIGSFQAFTPAFVVSGGTGGPLDSTLLYTLYLYEQGWANFRMGYASAMAWVLLGIIGAITAVAFLTSRYWVHYTDGDK